uniref:Uncharacterized protein n=1 Tax=Ditylenchus dipsaci TaxID=166011 RepID=A0A915DGH5_9BILA
MTLGDTLKQPEKAENTAQTPMLVSSSTLANLLPQKAYSKASGGYGFDSREYQLSYGVETSMSPLPLQ